MASSMKLTELLFSKHVLSGPLGAKNCWSPRDFVTASKPLLKEKELSDKQIKETSEKVTEAADAVKEGAKEVSNMSKTVSGKVSEAAENIMDKAKDTAFKAVTEKIKEKIIGK
ncbi:hypothetical protein LguiB_026044 [Lonicera macranthoides]